MGRAVLAKFLLPLFLFTPLILCGQSLRLSSATAAPGSSVEIEVSFKSPPGYQVSTLQWETTIPSGELKFADESSSTSPSAQANGKSINCAVKASTIPDTQTAICILSGGRGPIPDGLVSLLHLNVNPGAKPQSARIRVGHALAVSKELIRFPLDPAESLIEIRAK